MPAVKKVLTIAGSDPGGGAGIQADLKTFSKLEVYGMAVVSALTAQNTLGVSSVAEVSSEFVAEQLDAVFADIRPHATKTGMLLTDGVIEVVAAKVGQYGIANLVVDPVMVSSSGSPLLQPEAISTLRRTLLPQAFLLTPNANEAQALTGKAIRSIEDMEDAALKIHGMGARNVLIKGGHTAGDEATDVLFDGTHFSHFRGPRISGADSHGTGCVLSAAIAAFLAKGKSLNEAVQLGKDFVTTAIQHALKIGSGTPVCDPLSLQD